jgi:hypothetical protein
MTPEQFVYWLQGYFELTDDTDRLSRREHIIRDHLNEVFEKRTPDRQIYWTPETPNYVTHRNNGGCGKEAT